ncbi:MAG: hypothetical protein QOF11_134 [Chloroflexota bacterium]|jgi:deazaflavin-dependent oxidoreductase (nitroreductase family)|nr:hypothetical protein [Chloroflexota bacterium]
MPDDEVDPFTRDLIADLREHGKATTGRMVGRPLMVLTTTGAKTGRPRTAIVTYTRDGDRYVIAGTKSGDPTHPAWYLNLLADPNVTVEAGGERFAARATVIEGEERSRLWNQHAAERAELRDYPAKTSRVIPVIVLDRVT